MAHAADHHPQDLGRARWQRRMAEWPVPPARTAAGKEYVARGTWLFPVDAALRLTADVMAFCAHHVPKFNPISVSGAHLQQAGATRVGRPLLTSSPLCGL